MTVILRAYEMGYEKLEPALIEKAKELSKKNVGGTILVLFNRAESTFWNKIFTGISDEIKANGYRMQMYIVEEDDRSKIPFKTAIDCDNEFTVVKNKDGNRYREAKNL